MIGNDIERETIIYAYLSNNLKFRNTSCDYVSNFKHTIFFIRVICSKGMIRKHSTCESFANVFAKLEDGCYWSERKFAIGWAAELPLSSSCVSSWTRTWPSRPIHNNPPSNNPTITLTEAQQLLPWEIYRCLIKKIR